MKFNLKQVEAFVWVADLGDFRKAAARLHTTQPNISGRIAALETVLDTRLYEEITRHFVRQQPATRLIPPVT